jgi:hypothetical protein
MGAVNCRWSRSGIAAAPLSGLVRLRRLRACDSGDAVLAHDSCDPAPADFGALHLQLLGDPLCAVSRIGRVYFGDQLKKLFVVALAGGSSPFGSGPAEVAGVIGGEDPADPPGRESVAELVDEREAFPCGRVMNQGLGRFA